MFRDWAEQVGCPVLLCQAALFRSSDATLKATESHFRENTVLVEKGAPHIVAAWCFKHAIFKSIVGAIVLSFAERGIRILGIAPADAKESAFSNKFHVLRAPSSGEGAQVCLTKLVCQA